MSRSPVLPRVLVVDDDHTVSEVVVAYLERSGFDVAHADDGGTALTLAKETSPDLIVLDLMLPGRDGLDVCRELRASGSQVPIIMLTALGEESERVLGLEYGADDYITKPFSPRELVLRVQSVLRRATGRATGADEPRILQVGDIDLDLSAHRASLGGRPLALTGREFDLLAFMLAHPGQAFTRDELMQQVWGWTFGDQSTVTVHVRRLREKIEEDPADPHRLVTVWGVGYRFDPEQR